MIVSNSKPLSGTQYTLRSGDYTATVAAVGATLRSLTHAGRDLIHSFTADSMRPAYRGAVLVPWPNRVVDGQYYFGGHQHTLALTEPERGHALHGLAAWALWHAIVVAEDHVVLKHTITAQPGYPFQIDITVSYTLSGAGLDWGVNAVNTGSVQAPYGAAPHPYLIAGEGLVDDWTLTVPAAEVLSVSAQRLIPIGLRDVAGYDDGSLDFRAARPVGDTFIDHAYTAVDWSDEGTACVELRAPSGTGVRMSWDQGSPWVQVHTPESPGPDSWRTALAVEPMTCPPDAFNSGTDIIRLSPGDEHTVRWQIAALRPHCSFCAEPL